MFNYQDLYSASLLVPGFFIQLSDFSQLVFEKEKLTNPKARKKWRKVCLFCLFVVVACYLFACLSYQLISTSRFEIWIGSKYFFCLSLFRPWLSTYHTSSLQLPAQSELAKNAWKQSWRVGGLNTYQDIESKLTKGIRKKYENAPRNSLVILILKIASLGSFSAWLDAPIV